MKKMMYRQPSVKVVDIVMVQTLCASGDGGWKPDPKATTDEQL